MGRDETLDVFDVFEGAQSMNWLDFTYDRD